MVCQNILEVIQAKKKVAKAIINRFLYNDNPPKFLERENEPLTI